MAMWPSCWKVRERAFGCIDRDVGEVGASQALKLGVEIGEIAPLKQRIVGEVDSRRNVLGHERDLFGLREEVVGHAVEHEPTDGDWRQDFLWNDLRRIQHIELERVGEVLVEQLQLQFPFREIAGLDGRPEIAAMEIGIGAIDLDGFVPERPTAGPAWVSSGI